MGIMNTANMVRQAMQARKKMSQIKGVGQSGIIKGLVIDGLYSVDAVEVNKDELRAKLSRFNLSDDAINTISTMVEKDIKGAMEDAKKHLEKQLASSTSLDDLKSMLGGS